MARCHLLALDVGERRIGVALADTDVRIAIAYGTIEVDGTEIEQIIRLIDKESISSLIVGYPRNQSGDTTAQTTYVESFMSQFPPEIVALIEYQDESLTSVKAEETLKQQKASYKKGDIDALAACFILQDYLEAYYGRV